MRINFPNDTTQVERYHAVDLSLYDRTDKPHSVQHETKAVCMMKLNEAFMQFAWDPAAPINKICYFTGSNFVGCSATLVRATLHSFALI
jgi:hypothetical protein